MKFTFDHHRAIQGNDIDITVEAGDDEILRNVRTVLDGFEIGSDDVDPGTVQYQRSFLQAGEAGPLMNHTVVVTVTGADGKPRSATRKWQDLT